MTEIEIPFPSFETFVYKADEERKIVTLVGAGVELT